MSRIVSTGTTCAHVDLLCKNIDEFAFAFVSPLGPEDNGHGYIVTCIKITGLIDVGIGLLR